MSHLARLTMVLALAIGLAGCETAQVGWHAEPGTDFARYGTYAWGPSDLMPTGDPRFDNNPFFMARVQSAAEQQMAAKGLQKSAAEDADLSIHYHFSVSERVDIFEVDRRFSVCAEGGCEPEIVMYEEGTLMFDILETGSDKLVWRGWALGQVPPELVNDQPALNRAIDGAVGQIFENFPPRG